MDNQGRGSPSGGPVKGAGSAPARDRWRFVPMAGWIRCYERRWLKDDLIAGVAVAALIVPKNPGYAGIAGIPLQNGLYAAAAGATLYAVFGTSRQISTGPSSGLAAVAASAVAFADGIAAYGEHIRRQHRQQPVPEAAQTRRSKRSTHAPADLPGQTRTRRKL